MPLLIKGGALKRVPSCIRDFFNKYNHFKDEVVSKRSQPVSKVGAQGLLYVLQREYAGTAPEDDVISVLGSEDATTCHIVIIRHTGSGATSLGHFDGCDTESAVRDMVKLVTNLSEGKMNGRIEVHMYGGFIDDQNTSAELSLSLLDALHKQPEDIHLMTACITDLNDEVRGGIHWPVFYGVAVNVKTGETFKASFPDKGPDIPLRAGTHFTGMEEMMNMYDMERKLLKIGPFSYGPFPYIDRLLLLPDEYYRMHLSTSPAQEPSGFEADVRKTLEQIKNHPDPMKTVFIDGKPRFYKKEKDGNWVRVDG
ncbi:protein N-terminal asparagine amidohydrolase [Lingula anatina]|uniref:Protein N-terminal asparagine amidohydrolase n=1 Tax=Lingula anatina TaxID=7574 RepID=A0A1S3I894_LINAN|nr:protein N-terminal asparagine amidohydrolase [Lingula anatina]XP_013394419.1 protein N-terminal asparagine amidohydrolase [Lingula anatina]|eukprot:XP_013394418.1 protein N-terminal asparagine amidohydrolase [Lingula anatina]